MPPRPITVCLLVLFLALGGCDGLSIDDAPCCPDGPCRPDGSAWQPTVCRAGQLAWAFEDRLKGDDVIPPMDLPPELRERNYSGGSCVHASTIMVLRWQGMEELADWWRQTYAHGESSSGLIGKADKAGLAFAYTLEGDEQFLDWVSSTRRGATIFYYPNHSICFNGFTDHGQTAVLLDNNRIDRYITLPRAEFLRAWRGYGGFAFTPVGSPAPPRPFIY